MRGVSNFIRFLVCVLFVVSVYSVDDKTVRVVGIGECADCKVNNIKTSQAFSGLRVTIDCKVKNGELKRRGSGELDAEGKFEVSLPKEILKDGKLNEECYAQLHSASATPCPAHNGHLAASKIVLKSQTDGKEVIFGPAENVKFTSALCASAFFWPYFKHPPLPIVHPWFSHPPLPIVHPWFSHPPLPKLTFPPIYKKPCPPIPYKQPLPPPVPVYKPAPKPPVVQPLPPPVPIYKPTPPVYKPPIVKKPCPPKVYKPKPPVYHPPVVVKPLPPPVPIYHPPVIVKPLPPPVPIYKPPVYQNPHPPFPFKKPCPPLGKFPPVTFPPHPIFGHLPPFPPHMP